jgi:hypothetical protein
MVRGPAKRILSIFKAHAQREALMIPSKSLWVTIFSYSNATMPDCEAKDDFPSTNKS